MIINKIKLIPNTLIITGLAILDYFYTLTGLNFGYISELNNIVKFSPVRVLVVLIIAVSIGYIEYHNKYKRFIQGILWLYIMLNLYHSVLLFIYLMS